MQANAHTPEQGSRVPVELREISSQLYPSSQCMCPVYFNLQFRAWVLNQLPPPYFSVKIWVSGHLSCLSSYFWKKLLFFPRVMFCFVLFYLRMNIPRHRAALWRVLCVVMGERMPSSWRACSQPLPEQRAYAYLGGQRPNKSKKELWSEEDKICRHARGRKSLKKCTGKFLDRCLAYGHTTKCSFSLNQKTCKKLLSLVIHASTSWALFKHFCLWL